MKTVAFAVVISLALSASSAFAQNISPTGKVCKKSTSRAQCHVNCQACDSSNSAAGCKRFCDRTFTK